MNDLKKQFSEFDDFMLLRIVYFESSEYSEDAIETREMPYNFHTKPLELEVSLDSDYVRRKA